MRLTTFAASIAASLLAATAFAAESRPAAPRVTVGADLKSLIFDWDRVPRASYYQLLQNADGGSGFSPVGARIPATRTQTRLGIAAHLQRWQSARYVVAACNSAGCRDSAVVFPRDLMLDTIGYFKASNTDAGDEFGEQVLLSLDGSTLVVNAIFERSNATGVNGNQADNSFERAGAVYVFRRSGGKWRQEAYLKPPINQPSEWFGYGYPLDFDAIAISGNGTRIAVGATGDSSAGFTAAGAVYTYRRTSGGNWVYESRVLSPAPEFEDFFGQSVEMTTDARFLKVTNTRPRDGEGNVHGRSYIYERSGNTWRHQTTVEPFYEGDFCAAVRMSGDGSTLVQHCYNYNPAPPSGRLVTLKRQGSNWVHAGDIPFHQSFSGQWPELSHDAARLALRIGPLNQNVRIWRWTNSAWVEEATFDSPVPEPGQPTSGDSFGYGLEFNRTGSLLAVAASSSGAVGAGVSETPSTTWGDPHGAVFLYQRRSNGTWSLRSQIKAPNPGFQDGFGRSLSMCGTGRTLAVSASGEDSKARGVDGNQLDNSKPDSGAAYLY